MDGDGVDARPASDILRPGDTCWRIAHADRLRVIVDAADYFATFRSVAQEARHSLLLIGWDFDTRIELDRADGHSEVPNRLGRFLSWLVRNRPNLQIHMLEWDVGLLLALGRGSTPLRVADLVSSKRVRLQLDHAHPAGAAHHQKIVVIDDVLAFCGGIDMTAGRWDTPAHQDHDPLRVSPTLGWRFPPWHDVTTVVDGDAARALGDLARERWRRACGEEVAPPPPTAPIWPEGLVPTLEDVEVGISRSAPDYDGRDGVREIEALYLDIVKSARRHLYIESQYFASRRIAEAMAERLREPDGPEIVVVNPLSAQGWLEEEAMGSARAKLLRMVRRADRYGRFGLYTPVAKGGTPIYVHAKVVIMDDRLLRVGSSNLNNRSMGFDTECDLTVEVGPGDPDGANRRRHIAALRADLLAEHLGVRPDDVEVALAQAGGFLIGAIEALRSDGRSLVPFKPPELNALEEEVLAENELLDPERASRRWRPLSLPKRLPWSAA
ncbi:phospholipase D-like domain-containing protein [Rubellimicrobium roseum]|uniref:Phospholipase D n=1 Tax=Rubellimicrobium roseum TaxID=687525 RepID=A0A5C4ND81_9RHOB|nr:phospholipase D-like domain-containing protein [Rubellimicrobium roseum]TNC67507.1 phospholipase [Rubellimicrobium roseum]